MVCLTTKHQIIDTDEVLFHQKLNTLKLSKMCKGELA